MITNKQAKLLSNTWSAIEYALSSIDWTPYGKNLLKVSMEESKSHDRFRGESISRGMSLQQEAKYFAIKRLWEYVGGENALDIKFYLMTQRSCFDAYCIMTHDRFADARREILSLHKDDMKEIASWDYCDLIHEDKVSPGYSLDERRGFKRSPAATS